MVLVTAALEFSLTKTDIVASTEPLLKICDHSITRKIINKKSQLFRRINLSRSLSFFGELARSVKVNFLKRSFLWLELKRNTSLKMDEFSQLDPVYAAWFYFRMGEYDSG